MPPGLWLFWVSASSQELNSFCTKAEPVEDTQWVVWVSVCLSEDGSHHAYFTWLKTKCPQIKFTLNLSNLQQDRAAWGNCTANDHTVVQAVVPLAKRRVAVAAEETSKETKGRIPAYFTNLAFNNTVLPPASLKILLCLSIWTRHYRLKSGPEVYWCGLHHVLEVWSMSGS